MAFRGRADDDPTLYWILAWKLCDFQGIRTSIAKKPYMFVIVGGPDPLPPLLDQRMEYKSKTKKTH